MRETLTALAILLIVALTAALAAPYFIDWNSGRGFLEARLSRALGQKVTVGGSIDLKLLPTPYLVLNQAVIGGDDGPISLGIRHLNLELSVAPLLHGEFDIVEAQLDEPTIRITLQRDRTLPALPAAPAFEADVRFDRITITDGTLAVADPESGRTFALEHLDLQAEAESLAGPFRGSGTAGESAARSKFRFVTGAAEAGKTHVKLVVDETPAHAGLDLDGTLAVTGAPARPSFEGLVAVAGHAQGPGVDLLPWRLAAPVRGDLHEARWTTGELRLGAEERNLTLAAAGRARFGEGGDLHLDLVGKQLDLDRFAARPVRGDAAPPPPTLSELLGLSRAAPVLPTSVSLSVASATYGGAALSDLESTFSLGSGAAPFRLALDAPGGTQLTVEGTAARDPGPSFSGHVAARASDVPAARDWLARIAPDFSLPDTPFRAAQVQADVRYAADGLDVRALTLRLDRSTLTGSLHLTAADDAGPAAIRADLKAAALDLQTLPDLRQWRTAAAAYDLDLHFEARGIKVARFGDGGLDTGQIRFALAKTGGRFTLEGFRIDGLGGATLGASATLDPTGGHLDATLDANRLADLAALVQRVAPSPWMDAMAARASVLAPARLALAADLNPLDSPDGATPRRLSVTGTLGASRLNVAVSPDPAGDRKVVAVASVEAPEGSLLMRQMGLPILAAVTLGAGRVTLEARGPPGGALVTSAHASVGATKLDLSGRLSLGEGSASGMARLASPDVSPALQALAIAFPDLFGRLPVDVEAGLSATPAGIDLTGLKGQVSGSSLAGTLAWRGAAKAAPALTGALSLDRLALPALLNLALGPPQQPAPEAAWSTANFGSGLIDPPVSAVDLKVQNLDIGRGLSAGEASATLAVSRGSVALRGLKGRLGGGDAQGDLTLRRDGVNAILEGTVTLADVALTLPGIAGRLAGRLALAGSGRSALALVSSLSGSGEATLGDLQVSRADPSALPRVFDDVEGDRVSVDEESILRALEEAGGGALAAGTRPFAVSLAAGILHLDPKPDEGRSEGAVRSAVSLAFDLRRSSLEARVEQTLQALPKNWSGAPPAVVVQLAGPLAAPTRTVNAGPFINALAGRVLARETARIEAYEADARERSFFNQRLQADRRREAERLKAEEDARLAEAARKAEAERRAREAAVRLERARKAEEAAQEKAAQDKAIQDRAVQDRAARDRAERASQRQAPETVPPAPSGYEQPSRPPEPLDPSAAGRY